MVLGSREETRQGGEEGKGETPLLRLSFFLLFALFSTVMSRGPGLLRFVSNVSRATLLSHSEPGSAVHFCQGKVIFFKQECCATRFRSCFLMITLVPFDTKASSALP